MRRLQFIALVAPVVTVVVLLLALRTHQPAYGGKTLSQWLTSLERTPLIMNPEAGYALKAMGTNGIPYLVAGINAQDSKPKSFGLSIFGYQRFARFGIPTAVDKERRAIIGFEALGSNATPAIPSLVISLTNPPTSEAAAMALVRIGPAGLCALTNAAVSPNREVKLAFLMALLGQFKMRGVTFPAHHEERALVGAVHLPFLIRLLHDSITEIRAFAAEVLGAVHVKAALVVPELERLLNDPELFTRSVAIDALGEYGTEAKSAAPGLVQHIKQAKGASEKETAIKVLQKIDPEAAAQFEPR